MASEQRHFSSHHCLGGWDAGSEDLGSVDGPWARLSRNQKERTCLFRNVCLQHGAWTYFAAHGTDFPQTGTGHRFRSAVDIWARGNFAHSEERSVDHWFTLKRGSPVPFRSAWLRTGSLVKLAALAPSNLGHFLGNALYPAFVAMWRLFGSHAGLLPMQLLLAGYNQSNGALHCRRQGSTHARRSHAKSPPSSTAMHAASRCAKHAALVGKFTRGLLPGLAEAPLLWEEQLFAAVRHCPTLDMRAVSRCVALRSIVRPTIASIVHPTIATPRSCANTLQIHPVPCCSQARARTGGRLCVRRLVVGTGDLGFSTVHRLANLTARRRPPQPLWGVFIDNLLRRLDDRLATRKVAVQSMMLLRLHATQLARVSSSPGHPVRGPEDSDCVRIRGAVMVVKHGRRALIPKEYALLQAHAERVLGTAVVAFDAGRTPLRLQLAHTRRAAVGISPDGGSSFTLSFLPRGGALVVLGSLERWLWSADGRLRAFYCQPRRRDARSYCSTPTRVVSAAALRPPLNAAMSDCYTLDAVWPCAEEMLSRAREHVLRCF